MSHSKKTIVCFGPGPKFKGGLANYNTSLAKALDKRSGTEVHIVSWTQQYPAIIPREFVDKSSKTDLLEGTDVQVQYLTNYNNPLSWTQTAEYIASLQPDKVVFQWSIAIQGLPLGRIIRRLKKISRAEIIIDCHFILQKEQSKLDAALAKYGIGRADTYIVHAMKTYRELEALFPDREYTLTETGERSSSVEEVRSAEWEEDPTSSKTGASRTSSHPKPAPAAHPAIQPSALPSSPVRQTVIKLYHPIYDLFQPDPDFDVEGFKREQGLRENVFLFFGFIRKYKGLHQAIRAFRKVAEQREDVSLLICGESFWNTLDNKKWSTRLKNATFGLAKKIFLNQQDNEQDYRPLEMIPELGLEDRCVVFNEYIANEDVHKYFQVSDAVVLYYLTATPSGIESLSYNFHLPILATKVGHFPETIREGYNGYLAEDRDIDSMAEQMIRMLDHPIPRENVAEKAKEMSWANYAEAVIAIR